jgi:hypothetical protein
VVAAVLVAVPAVAPDPGDGSLLALLGIAGWLLLAGALGAGIPAGVVPGVVVLGAEYALSLGPALDGRAPLYAAGLLVVAELSYWSLELRIGIAAEPGTTRVRAALVGVLAVSAVVLGGIMLGLSGLRLGGGIGWEVVGLAAAVGALALVAALARRTQRDMSGV